MAEIKAILRRHFQLFNGRGQTFFNCLFFQFCLKIQKTEKKLNLVYSERDGLKMTLKMPSNSAICYKYDHLPCNICIFEPIAIVFVRLVLLAMILKLLYP